MVLVQSLAGEVKKLEAVVTKEKEKNKMVATELEQARRRIEGLEARERKESRVFYTTSA